MSGEELLCTLLALQLVCAQHCLGEAFFGEGSKNNLEFRKKNAFKQSVNDLTAKLQFVSQRDSLLCDLHENNNSLFLCLCNQHLNNFLSLRTCLCLLQGSAGLECGSTAVVVFWCVLSSVLSFFLFGIYLVSFL